MTDWEGSFLENWIRDNPREPFIPLNDRTTPYIVEQYPPELKDKVEAIYHAQGFYYNLRPIPGSLEAIDEMLELGHDVRICTAPLPRYRNCVLEKFDWVQHYLGFDWVKRLMITFDKSLVHGDMLIDDFPQPITSRQPNWEHVLFTAPYNREVTNRPRLNGWSNWHVELGL